MKVYFRKIRNIKKKYIKVLDKIFCIEYIKLCKKEIYKGN